MLQIPPKLKAILSKEPRLDGQITSTVAVFSGIYADNKLYFFPEYTNHGLEHINSVLQAAEEIIEDNTFDKILTPKDVAVLILSIILHDLGMQLSFDSFKTLINGKNDDIKIDILDEKTWSQLWDEYLDEAKKFSGKQLRNIFGNEFHTFRKPNLEDRLNTTEADRLLIGEFIRRHHPRIAHEVALKGLAGKNNEILDFAKDTEEHIKKLAGIVARSHGMEIRDTFEYLHTLSEYEWANPYSVNVIFLMVVLRIADYFQFDNMRVDKKLLKLKTFSSPISQIEHDKHLSIDFVKPFVKDPETLYVEAKPDNSNLYLKLEQLFKDIQYELDISWAVLGEIYGKEQTEKQPKIKYRRIKSNLEKRGNFVKSVEYVPEKMVFDYDPDLAKLLIAPLYGDNPTFGVRELLQNAIDACRERELEEKRLGNEYEPLIEVAITEEKGKTYFTITDNGKGMTLYELKNYFLKAGSSFRKSIDWQKKYTNEEGKSEVMRSGRFGVGVLAAFLLGDEIEVTTKSIHDRFAYNFKARLGDEQINIKRFYPKIKGTKISILLDSITIELLKNDNFTKTPPTNKSITVTGQQDFGWAKWYKFDYPKITYLFYGSKITTSELINIENITGVSGKITTGLFDTIIWNYDSKSLITCNGIVIPNSHFAYLNNPSIHIIDKIGNLNLALNRNSLNGELPFTNEIIYDIIKDFIAFLFCFEPRHKIVELNLMFNKQYYNQVRTFHPSRLQLEPILLHKNGFILLNSFFGKKLNKYKILKVYSFHDLDFPNNILFKKEYISNYLYHISLAGGAEYLHFMDNPDNDYRNISFIKKIIDFDNMQKLEFYVEEEHYNSLFMNSYTDISSTYGTKYQTPLQFDSILRYYFGENYIIPYDLEDRKKMYPKAFEELEPYMRKYLIKTDE